MAFHRFIKQVLLNQPIEIFGDGQQSRDFTFISDCVEGISAAGFSDGAVGETINIGGKERATLLTCVSILEEAFGSKINIQFTGPTYGEPQHTWADITKAQTLLGYNPQITLKQGLRREIEDLRHLYSNTTG
jgi:nucleoside-diphosphate-sugar epimerase